MAQRHRLTIRSIDPDPRAAAIAAAAEQLGTDLQRPEDVQVADLYFVEGDLDQDERSRLHGFLVDPLLQKGSWSEPTSDGTEITFLPGVTDTAAATLLQACERLGFEVSGAATGRRIEFGESVDATRREGLVKRIVANPVIERWEHGCIEPNFHPVAHDPSPPEVIPIAGRTLEELVKIGDLICQANRGFHD